jgi:hypothetical protein
MDVGFLDPVLHTSDESRRLVESLVLARIIFSRNHSLHSMTLGTSRWPSIILVLDSTTRVHHWALG